MLAVVSFLVLGSRALEGWKVAHLRERFHSLKQENASMHKYRKTLGAPDAVAPFDGGECWFYRTAPGEGVAVCGDTRSGHVRSALNVYR